MKKIAVVEDNPDNRLLVRVILEPLYDVAEYEDGASALAGLQQQQPDLVLLDVSLPEMDGTEVLRRIRADARLQNLPVIALTAHAMTGDREKFLATGFDDYVTKPILDEKLLLAAIQARLAGGKASAIAPMNQSSPLDLSALEQLRRLGGDDFTGKMIGLFLDYGGTKLAEARQAFAAGDLAAVAEALHPLKSSAGNVGASRVRDLAAEAESLARQHQSEALTAMLDELSLAFAANKAELDQKRQMLGSEGTKKP
jgi:CheY-like chemotaxis protein/HPt (histidine-containing phosphotransfer) domain-containing protein